VAVDTRSAGRRYGHLTVAWTIDRGRGAACRCICTKLIHVAAADLVSGAIDSCGCQPASAEFWRQQAERQALQRREIDFNIAGARR
jgi:hypothetical protein